ncbi:hypothetical protein V6Z11_D01G259200 [Gossypium hirsutum]
MELSTKHMEVFNSFFLVYIEVIIFLSCFNLLGLATGSPVVGGNDTDHQALLQFKAKITGYQLEVMESWNSSIHFCQWRGVTCGRKHRRVTKLELKHLKLSGSLSPYVGNMSFLRELKLQGNRFYSKIPQEIGRLRRPQILDLTNNSISGEIPSNLSACSKLIVVYMGGNQLAGEIPALLGHLSQVKFLSFRNNDLRGSIPPSFGNLSSLEELRLEFNGLTGIIPEALGRLTNLSYFMVVENAISGIFPMAMFNLSNIIAIDIGANKIQGTLHFDLAVTMPNVEFFSIWGNQISGQIPIAVWNASSLNTLQLNNNRLTGNVPSLEKLDKLIVLELHANALGRGREGDLKFFCTLVNNTKLLDLFVGVNNFGGALPKCISNFSSTLLHLSIYKNKISGRILDRIGNLINLELLDASENQLSGPIPFDIGRHQKLQRFYIDRNFLSGTIPDSIGNLTMLTAVNLAFNNLQGSIPSSLGHCQNLLAMSLSHNNLSGPIPPQAFELPFLSIFLDLKSNYLTVLVPLTGISSTASLLGPSSAGSATKSNWSNSDKLATTPFQFHTFSSSNLTSLLTKTFFAPFSTNWPTLSKFWSKSGTKNTSEISLLPEPVLINTLPLPLASISLPSPILILEWKLLSRLLNSFSSAAIWCHSLMLLGSLLSMLPHLCNGGIGSQWRWFSIILDHTPKIMCLEISLHFNYPNVIVFSSEHWWRWWSETHSAKLILNASILPNFELAVVASFWFHVALQSSFQHGGLPLTVGKLKNLAAFRVSRNRLSGLLPNNLGSCVHLEALILGGNLFEGPIPSSLSSLRGLVLLDVSDNNLSGDVPEFLVSFGALKYLNLSFNDFEGLIPSEGVFKNKSATFVEGNNKLCGGIPELHLSRCNSKTSSDTSLKLKVAIIVVILGVALVFSCLLILWFRKKKELPTTTCAENSILQLSYQSILRATDGFSVQNLLGSGSFGSVYKGILEESGAVIAVKVLNLLNRGASS